jgi:fumarate reductase subunit D
MFLESHEASEREEPQIIPLMRILFKALPAAVLMGVLYGVSLYIFNVNIIIIPFLGFAWLGYIMYERGTASVNWISNFFLGLFSAGQMVVAVVTHLMLSLRIPFSIDNILQVTWEYLLLLIAKPMDQFPVFLTISLLFICGMLYGKSFRFTRALRKLRMQKKGDYYIRRKNGVIDIFLIDPADYVEMEERTMLTLTEGCLIVKDGKNVGVLFIPKKSLDEAGINIGNRGDDNVVLIDNNQYYKIDLGGTGSYKPYVYPCHLWCNLSRQVELISIQI